MSERFLLIPDYQVFETAFLAKQEGDLDNSCLVFFKTAWGRFIDSREKNILITRELNEALMLKHYKSEKTKRQALFSVVLVHYDNLGCETSQSQIKLASMLSIEADKKIYYITDNQAMKEILQDKIGLFEVKSTKEAIQLLSKK